MTDETDTRNPMAVNRVRVCQCGCGEPLPRIRKHGRYISAAHRMRAWRARRDAAASK